MLLVAPNPLIVTRPRRRTPVVVIRKKVSADVNWPEETGKFLGLFVLFTSSMNWWFYRQLTREKKDRK